MKQIIFLTVLSILLISFLLFFAEPSYFHSLKQSEARVPPNVLDEWVKWKRDQGKSYGYVD